VRLELQVVGEDSVAVQLVQAAGGGADLAAAADMDAEVAPDSSYASSSSSSGSSSDDEGESEGEEGPLDIIENYEDIRKMIDDMDADVGADEDGDEDGAGGGGGGGTAHRAEAELLGAVPLPSLAALSISKEDAVQAAGTVQTMLEGMIVVKVRGQG